MQGAKPTVNGTVIPVSFRPNSTDARDSIGSGTLQVLYNVTANTGGTGTVVCSGWGDPHYATWDGAKFNFQAQGTFYLV
jgi:hypothetical protein